MRSNLAFLILLLLTGCTYNVVQQQNGTPRARNQTVSIGGGGYSGSGVGVAQSDGGQAVLIGGNPVPNDPPPSTYPEYNGYPGSGYRGGPIAPAYDPRSWNVPNWEAWRYRVY